MIKSKLLFQNLTILLIAISIIVYLVFIFSLFSEVLESCITEILLISNNLSFVGLTGNSKFYLYILSVVFLSFLIFRIISGIFYLISSILKTELYLANLNKEKYKDFYIVYSNKSFAFTAGFLRPQIYISSNLLKKLSKKEIDSVITHELIHKNSHDPLKKILIKTFVKIFIPFPNNKSFISTFILMRESVASINIELIKKINPLENSLLSYYGDEINLINPKKKNYLSFIYVIGLTFLFLFISAFLNISEANSISVCHDESSCLLLERSDNITKLPGQCREILYTPVPNYSRVSRI